MSDSHSHSNKFCQAPPYLYKGRPPRILLLGDYSNLHATLASGLRTLGSNVTVISDGSTFMECERDFDISRKPGKLGGLMLTAKLLGSLRKKLEGYDIVSLRDPNFLELRPQRTGYFFHRLLRNNKSVFLTALTTDVPFLDLLESRDCPLKYSEWFIGFKPNRLRVLDEEQWNSWHLPVNVNHHKDIYNNIDGAVSVLYEYHLSLQRALPEEKISYGGIPIDLDKIDFIERETPRKVRIFLGRDRRRKLIKGTDFLEEAARRVADRHPDKVEFVLVENVPRKQFFETMFSCHIVLDQIYSYTPGTTALEAMAAGLTTVTGAEDDYYRFIGEDSNFPAINAPIDLDALTDVIGQIALNPHQLRERGIAGREFVRRHNDVNLVAERFLRFWLERLNRKDAINP